MSRYRPPFRVDPLLTLGALRQGLLDPQIRLEARSLLRATWTPAGPASTRLTFAAGEVFIEAWGSGADAAIEELPALLGAHDDPSHLVPRHALVADLARRLGGMRMARTGKVLETLVPTVIGQKVTGLEAWRSHRALLYRFGEPAPGPLRLRLPPRPLVLAGQPYHAFHALGLERRRADVIREVAGLARALEGLTALSPVAARERLTTAAGVGPWTAAETMRVALGDPDALSVGDYNLPDLVCWALAGERRGTDAWMLELLEPYAGQRARVVRLLELGGVSPPRHGPRLQARSIRRI